MGKHSVTLRGHRTSYSLEAEFQAELESIARSRGVTVARLVSEVDEARSPEVNLSSALRLFVLDVVKK